MKTIVLFMLFCCSISAVQAEVIIHEHEPTVVIHEHPAVIVERPADVVIVDPPHHHTHHREVEVRVR